MLQQSRSQGIVLMADPLVTAILVRDIGEGLADLRSLGFRISSALADEAGAFAHVRIGVASRLRQAVRALPNGVGTDTNQTLILHWDGTAWAQV
jgi:D-alanyl-D-alanine dipeptidase